MTEHTRSLQGAIDPNERCQLLASAYRILLQVANRHATSETSLNLPHSEVVVSPFETTQDECEGSRFQEGGDLIRP